MKLKYKKIILFISFGVMFIGFIVFSMIPFGKKKGSDKENQSGEPSSIETSLMNPSDISLGEFKKNAYPEINDLVKRYFDAKMAVDMETMETLVSDTRQVDERKLRAQLEYIEGMQNIDCYTFDGIVEGTYRVYVYHELKIRNINTLAPALTGLYVTQNSEGTYNIYLSTLDEEAQSFIEASDNSKDALELKENVRVKLEEALNQDQALKEFYNMLEQGSENGEHTLPEGQTPPEGQPPEEQTPPEGQPPEEQTPPEGQPQEEQTPPEGQPPEEQTPPEGQPPEEQTPPEGQ